MRLFYALVILFTTPLIAEINFCEPCRLDCNPCNFCGSLYFHFDWLQWKSRRSDLDFVLNGNNASNNPYGKIEVIKPDNGGFRLGGFVDCDNGWSYGIRYTSHKQANEEKVLEAGELYSVREHPDAFHLDANNFARSKYDVSLSMFDVEANYIYEPQCIAIKLRPYGAIRFASIDQKMNTLYDQNTTDEDVTNTNAAKLREMIEMNSYGFAAGLQLDRHIQCGFSLIGRCGTGLALAKFESSHRMKSFETATTRFTNLIIEAHKNRVVDCSLHRGNGRYPV